MKKIATLFCFVLITGSFQLNAQCTPDLSITTPGLYPDEFFLPCIERGVAYDTVIQIKNFDTVYIGANPFVIDWIRVDALEGLPSGISYTCETESGDPNCKIDGFENACVRMSGTTNAPRGQYKLGIRLTIRNDQGLELQGIYADSDPLNFRYDLRVVDPGETCPDVDTTVLIDTSSGFYPYTAGIKEFDHDMLSLQVYPNRVSSGQSATVETVSKEKLEVIGKITDVSGRELFNEEYTLLAGVTKRTLDLSNFAPGAYFYNVSNSTFTSTVKFIILE